MSLREYKRKRRFDKTPEPEGKEKSARSGFSFVIQKHDASRLHYDFRLELDGTLKSWAVPKGPSLDPAVKALAVHVEDHPLDYASFEGVIPEGQYGGGTVMVWDRGTWTPEEDPRSGYMRGKLKFSLEGQKLHGSWALVRMGGAAGEDGKNWLLIKHDDEFAKPLKKYDVAKKEPLSVLTGRDLPEIAEDSDRVWTKHGEQKGPTRKTAGKPAKVAAAKKLVKKKTATKTSARKTPKKNGRTAKSAGGRTKKARKSRSVDVESLPGARPAPPPRHFRPQLATLADGAPTGDKWLHELKFDGYRIVAMIKNGEVRLVTRNDNDWTHRFTAVAEAAAALGLADAILDGEVVALNDEGISDFQKLQNALKRGDQQSLAYYVFDLPRYGGYDLTATPLAERKRALETLLGGAGNDGIVRYSDHVAGSGDDVIEQACRRGLEGIVSKRADAPYEHARSRAWLKVKCSKRQEFIICGFTPPTASRVGFGALILGYHKNGKLVYCGRVGTGFTDDSLRSLHKELNARQTEESPFPARLTTAQRRDVTWVRPELMAEVEFTEWTEEGSLRHPSFKGLREDKPARKITREEAVAMPRARHVASGSSAPRPKKSSSKEKPSPRPRASRNGNPTGDASAEVAGVAISHPDRVLYPEAGITKLDLAKYYESVAEWILPHVTNRPLTLVRCPGGRGGACFYQKHLGEASPESVRGVKIKEKSGTEEYVVIDDLAGLVSLVQLSVLEIHPWPARADDVESPDRIVFDLDPGEGVVWKDIVVAARELRDGLGALGLESFLRTSGGKGLHVVLPLARRNTWEQLKAFAKGVADSYVRVAPERYIATLSKAKRRGKIFIDYLRNQRGATAVASYSTRAREGAPVSAPLTWKELTARLKPNGFTVANMGRRLAKQSGDPWEGFFDLKQSITRKMEAALEIAPS